MGFIVALVLGNQHSGIKSGAAPVSDSSIARNVANPLDQLSSADIAQTVAQVNSLPETTAIANQAQSQAATMAIASTSNNIIAKPQIATASLLSAADIKTYVTKAGDTVSSLAAKFGVTSNSIIWSNDLSSTDALNPGVTLLIPPVNGVIYTVKPGDTAASLAVQFGANADQITAYNDAETGGLKPGQRIIIPGATHNNSGATAASISTASGLGGLGGGSWLWGSGPVYGYNGYDYGYCTWYVATQVPVPANWGNASTWAYYASMSGWNVSTSPSVGSIAQTADAAGGEGHVAIVTGVNPDGTINIRDMNGLAGWGRVGYGTVSASHFQHFISR
ncbi:MAG TPA: LysM peptidoglycan-binding domain-containing protein [Candidatus Saccharimonadales bacterium]|nr:LysM peptidoglycan-binding domain-containing protein [Candidatus Saccharimonadales bacterium]